VTLDTTGGAGELLQVLWSVTMQRPVSLHSDLDLSFV